MDLVARCQSQNWNRVAFVGATKHAGKTTALNGFVAQAETKGLVVGLCSIGLDGERLDTILGVEKPRIYAPFGTIVVSAEKALEASDAGLEWLEVLPIDSPLGRIVACRVIRPGHVMLAGVRQRLDVHLTVPKLLQYGADFALVDGAFDRVAAATPTLVDACVLAVGAVAGKTIAEVVRTAQPFIARFQLPEASNEWKRRMKPVYESEHIGWIANGLLYDSQQAGALFGITSHKSWSPDVEAVYLPGAVTDSVLAELLMHTNPLKILAKHPAQVLLGVESYRKLYRSPHQLSVYHRMPVAALACNPHSITGYDLPRQELQQSLAGLAGEIPVYDPLATEEVGRL